MKSPADNQIAAQAEAQTGVGPSADMPSRRKGAILGMFIGDALAMPVHWYYDRQALSRDYGRVTGYLAPKNPHPDSILWRSSYTPVNDRADILHDQARFWGRPGVHYHQFLQSGENTLNLKLCTLLIKTILAKRGYDADAYLSDYIAFMTTPGNHRDTYVEEYHRHFFTNYASGKPPTACGVNEKHISGVIGMIPLIVHYAQDPDLARRLAFGHLGLTHLGPRMAAAGEFLMDVLLPVLCGESLFEVIAQKVRRQDNPLLGHPLMRWLDDPDETVVGRRLSTACYVEDALPATAFLALKYHDNVEQGLVANTRLGGDNAGRGAVLGALLGAANGHRSFPDGWVKGLRHPPPDLISN
jgi:ADP-ribosyl-[dinitrogen reductase] hydrolase